MKRGFFRLMVFMGLLDLAGFIHFCEQGLFARPHLFVQQIALGLDSSLTTRAGSADGLAIDGVGAVAGDEDAGQLCTRCAVNLLQVTHLVGV